VSSHKGKLAMNIGDKFIVLDKANKAVIWRSNSLATDSGTLMKLGNLGDGSSLLESLKLAYTTRKGGLRRNLMARTNNNFVQPNVSRRP